MSPNEPLRVVPVRGDGRLFQTFPWKIYRDDPLWVPPLIPELRKRFSARTGAVAARAEVAAFLAYRGLRRVGRIAVANDRAMNRAAGRADCTFGFFESVHDQAVADSLFAVAEDWARRRSLTRLRGPFHFDYEDSYGVLLEGRDRRPTVLCGHTPPYYAALFETAGFVAARPANIAIELPIAEHRRRLERLAVLGRRALGLESEPRAGGRGEGGDPDDGAVVSRDGRIRIRQADFGAVEAEIDRLHVLLNEAMTHLQDSVGWERSSVRELVESVRPIADPRYVLFLEVEGRAVGWFAAVPNVNEILVHANGLRFPWDYLRLVAHRNDRPECLSAKSVLVLPSQWHTRPTIALLGEMARRVLSSPYRWVDLSLTSEDNPETPRLAEKLGGRIYKRYQVYERRTE